MSSEAFTCVGACLAKKRREEWEDIPRFMGPFIDSFFFLDLYYDESCDVL